MPCIIHTAYPAHRAIMQIGKYARWLKYFSFKVLWTVFAQTRMITARIGIAKDMATTSFWTASQVARGMDSRNAMIQNLYAFA